ncbi:MAG TPA: hypothetical protein ENJ10_00960 [Caldithrix abyssi]|uniref:CDP-diacylglycerol--glycerol-3-phosphate 3-phosphatidyltransferase n=1 Tax=Caldithrix abyssi TaxID=187145 RepID=A0A7V1LJM7_CALAY|nr:hypothetical protein [Caldithrix abyssi]
MIKKENRTLSNLLSFIRIFFIIPAFFLIKEQRNDLVLWLATVAMFTDWLDGFLARRWNQISDLGKILDPLADKVSIGGMVLALYLYQGFPLWLAALIILRDVSILIGAVFIYDKERKVASSNLPGKVSVAVIALAILLFLLGLRDWFDYSVYAVILALVVSLVMYAKVFIQLVKEKKNAG